MGSTIVGCFVVSKNGELFRIVDVWKGDQKASSEVLLEHISDGDSADFKWLGIKILDTMEVVNKDALEG